MMWQDEGCHLRDVLREFMGHNFVTDLCTLKLKNLINKKTKNLKSFFLEKKTSFFQSRIRYDSYYNDMRSRHGAIMVQDLTSSQLTYINTKLENRLDNCETLQREADCHASRFRL